jgi:hypothetical protein
MNEEVKGNELELRRGELVGLEEIEEEFEWSAELRAKMSKLRYRQREVIINLVLGERRDGLRRGRLLKSPWSCPWCGRSCQNGRTFATHEAKCHYKRVGRWKFVCAKATFYDWIKEPLFAECLKQPSEEAENIVVKRSFRSLQYATTEAVEELRWQVKYGRSERNRQKAAIAILDRAGIGTALKDSGPPRQLQLWLDGLRRVGEEEGEEE